MAPTIAASDVEQLLLSMFIDAPGTSLRKEDLKKSVEVAALLTELQRINRTGPLVDVAAGKSYLGLLAVELLGFEQLVVIERNEKRIADCRHALTKLSKPAKVDLHLGDVADRALWPSTPGVVTALHACGPASDAVIDAAIATDATWLLLVPCCYSAEIPFWDSAERLAERTGIPSGGEVRKRFMQAAIESARVLKLEAAGWETTVLPFVAPTVTPHNALFRARRVKEPKRMAQAQARLLALTSG